MKTIEEKLSAIKAINDRKDLVDKMIEILSAEQSTPSPEGALVFFNSKGKTQIAINQQALKVVVHAVLLNYRTERSYLIAQAAQLMK